MPDNDEQRLGTKDARSRRVQRGVVQQAETGRVCAADPSAAPDPPVAERDAGEDGREVLGDGRGRREGLAPKH